MNFEVIIPILFIIFVIIVAIWGYNYEKKNVYKVGLAYEEFANKFALEFIPGNTASILKFDYPKVIGKINDFDILLHTYKTGGKNQTTYTELIVTTHKHPFYFEIIKETFLQKVAQRLGIQYISIGNETLDKMYAFKADNEVAFIQMLDPEILQILEYLNPLIADSIESKNGVLRYNYIGLADTEEKILVLEKVLVLMLKLAKNYPTTKIIYSLIVELSQLKFPPIYSQ
jgi:hypothetical protein